MADGVRPSPISTPPAAATASAGDTPLGLACALAAYVLWGFLPLYMKALATVPAAEIIAHRILWSVPIALGVLAWTGRLGDVIAAFRRPRLLAMAGLTAALITVNWLTYVWAVVNDRALEAALGYYINPLFSVALGAGLLGERLTRAQGAALALAGAAVLLLTWEAGRLPAAALAITLSWGLYAFLKRRLPLGPNQGFALEVLLLTPLALAWLAFMVPGAGAFTPAGPGGWTIPLLLVGCGVVTAVPLVLFANGAKRARLTTISIMGYLTPTMVFVIAVAVFGEPWTGLQRIAYPMIWVALAIYGATLLRAARR